MNLELGRSITKENNKALKVITYAQTLSPEQKSSLQKRVQQWQIVYNDITATVQTSGTESDNQISLQGTWRPDKLRNNLASLDSFQTAFLLWVDCCKLWRHGFVHGDINQRNVRLDRSKPYLIDFEPFLIRLINGQVTGISTRTYFHPIDKKNGVNPTYRTDLLGLLCLFCSFIRKDIHPSLFVRRAVKIIYMFGWDKTIPKLDQINDLYREIEAQSGTI